MPESEEIALEKAIIHCFEEHRGNYGRIRIRKQLQTQGIQVSEAKIARILRKNGLKAIFVRHIFNIFCPFLYNYIFH